MSEVLTKTFEAVSGWREYGHFEQEEEGYITQERVGDALAFLFGGLTKSQPTSTLCTWTERYSSAIATMPTNL